MGRRRKGGGGSALPFTNRGPEDKCRRGAGLPAVGGSEMKSLFRGFPDAAFTPPLHLAWERRDDRRSGYRRANQSPESSRHPAASRTSGRRQTTVNALRVNRSPAVLQLHLIRATLAPPLSCHHLLPERGNGGGSSRSQHGHTKKQVSKVMSGSKSPDGETKLEERLRRKRRGGGGGGRGGGGGEVREIGRAHV